MYKIENKSIEIQTARGRVKTKNRILDNHLDWVIYSMLPASIGNAVFSKFADYGVAYFYNEYAYLQFNTPQTITDTDTTMTYDDRSLILTPDDILETIVDAKKLLFVTYLYAFSVPSTGDTFEGLGFGRDDSVVTDFLLSYVDLSVVENVYNEDYGYAVTRYDEISTSETIITGDSGFLPGYRYGTLESISMCYALNGAEPAKEYLTDQLTFAYVSAGNVSVTGFDDFFIEDGVIYPDTIYPYDSYLLYTMIINGTFVGTTGWTGSQAVLTAASNVLTATGNGGQVYMTARSAAGKAFIATHKYFTKAFARVTNSSCSALQIRTIAGYGDTNIATPTANQWYSRSAITTAGQTNTFYPFEISATYASAAIQSGKVTEIKDVVMIDLTALYGAGNEPTAAQMEVILANPAYIYPSQAGKKIQSVKFRYKGNDDLSTKYETYINIEDLGVDYNNTDVSINLICERG